jgi:hypothetical protein
MGLRNSLAVRNFDACERLLAQHLVWGIARVMKGAAAGWGARTRGRACSALRPFLVHGQSSSMDRTANARIRLSSEIR